MKKILHKLWRIVSAPVRYPVRWCIINPVKALIRAFPKYRIRQFESGHFYVQKRNRINVFVYKSLDRNGKVDGWGHSTYKAENLERAEDFLRKAEFKAIETAKRKRFNIGYNARGERI